MTLTESVDEVVEASDNPLLGSHDSWDRIRLKEVADVLNGNAFSSEYFTNGEGKPLLRIRDIGDKATEKNYSGEYEDRYVVHPGDLVVGMDGDFVCDLWNGPEALLNQRVCKITPDESLYNKKFLYYILQPYLDAIHARTSATTVKHLSSTDVKKIPLPSPPINEQKRIITKIDKLFSKLDSGIRDIKKANQQTWSYRRGVLKQALYGGRTQDYDNDQNESTDESVPELSSNNEEAIFPKSSDRPCIPKHWQWVSLEELFSFRNGDELSKDDRNPGDYPVYGGNGKTDSHDEWNIDSKALVIGRVGANCGNVHIAPQGSWITDNAIFTKEIKIDLSLRYLEFLLSSYPLNSLSGGTGQPYISQKTLKSIDVPLPPVSEQREIANWLDAQLSVIGNIREIFTTELKRGNRLRQSILKKAFEGNLVPQDPTEEPPTPDGGNTNLEQGAQATLSEVTSDAE